MQSDLKTGNDAEVEESSIPNRRWLKRQIAAAAFAVLAAALLTLWDSSQFRTPPEENPFWGIHEQERYAVVHVPFAFLKNGLSFYWTANAWLNFTGTGRILLAWSFVVPALAWPMTYAVFKLLPVFGTSLLTVPVVTAILAAWKVNRHHGAQNRKLSQQALLSVVFNLSWWLWAFLDFIYAVWIAGA